LSAGFHPVTENSPRTIRVPCRWFHMEYRGKIYTIVQGVGPHSWKWSVRLDDKTVKSGDAPTRAAAKNSVVWLVDKTLAKQQKPPAG
jgi:hypothetical protein